LERRIGQKPLVVYPECLSFKWRLQLKKTSRIGYAGWPALTAVGAVKEQMPV
jgi:hypothetical protein